MLTNTLFVTLALAVLKVTAQDPPCDATDPKTPQSICAIRAAFGGSTVVPDVIPSFLPTGELHTVYGNVDVGGAQQLSPSRVSSTPLVSFSAVPNVESGPKYLLIMVDNDAGANAGVLHWMQTDLTVGANNRLVTDVKAAAPYAGPAPPEGSGTHRYVTLLYTQPSDFKLPSALENMPASPQTGSARLKFSLSSFVDETKLDGPAGGMFFKSTYDGETIPGNTVSQSATGSPGSGAAPTSSSRSTSSSQSTSQRTSSTTTGASQQTNAPGGNSSASRVAVGAAAVVGGFMGFWALF